MSHFLTLVATKRRRGFTLIEIIIVIALTSIIAGFAMIVSLDDYRGFNFRNERDIVVAVLQKARSQAVSNMCFGASCTDGKSHGVYFGTPGSYIVFQGSTYATRDTAVDEVIEAKDGATGTTGVTEVVFDHLSGSTTTLPSGSNTLTVTDDRGRTSVFTIESTGRIWWTN